MQSPLLGKILIIDDEQDICLALSGVLTDEGHHVLSTSCVETALKLVKKEQPDVCFLDVWLQNADGVEILDKIRQMSPDTCVIMISGHASIETAVKCTQMGASDFIEKPLSIDKILLSIKNALQIKDLRSENMNLKKRIEKKHQIIGKSKEINQIIATIKLVSQKNATILITGENGTGKENVARLIHSHSLRAERPFVAINCAAIPEELIESELFGHEKGAFTGATAIKRGKFELAHKGTLFLDEIGDMSLKTQSKLLRALQEQRIERVGSDETISIEARIIAATNKNLEEEIKKGNFREDLFYRINVIPIHIPPLRQRQEDISLIAKHYLEVFSLENGLKIKTFTEEAIQILQAYPWPGNVRELKNIMERLTIMVPEETISAHHLPHPIGSSQTNEHESIHHLFEVNDFRSARALFEKSFIQIKLEEFHGNISKTAEALGFERSHLYRKLKQYDIQTDTDRNPEVNL